nr:hypothetical protein [Candidatus Njordarchaeum guaymaensis]
YLSSPGLNSLSTQVQLVDVSGVRALMGSFYWDRAERLKDSPVFESNSPEPFFLGSSLVKVIWMQRGASQTL